MANGWSFKPNRTLISRINNGAAKGIQVAAEYVLGESNEKAPIEESTLIRSGVASSDPATLRAAVSYNTPYAVRQHEDLALRHDAGREAKWLENTLNAEADNVRTIIAETIRGEL